jgi:hypothetical protein
MTTTQALVYTLELTEAEQAVLLRLLDQTVIDLHGERRRTEAAQYHADIVQEENLVRNLAEKVRKLRTA